MNAAYESCPSCGAAVSEGARFCQSCGQPVAAPPAPDGAQGQPAGGAVRPDAPAETPDAPDPDQAKPPGRRGKKPRTAAGQAASPDAPGTAEPPLQWECRIALLTNRFILWDMLKVLVISLLVLQLLGALTTFVIDGEAFFMPLQVFLIPVGVLIVLYVLAAGVVLGNRFDMRFTLDSRRIVVQGQPSKSSSRIIRILSFLPLFMKGRYWDAYGAATSSPGETTGEAWRDVERIREYPRERVISLCDSWHTLVRLYCTPEVYDEAVARCRTHATPGIRRREKRIAERARPAWGFWAVWVVLATAGTLACGGWYWASELRDRFAILAGLLVLFSGLLPEVFAWLTAAAGAICSLIVLGTLLVPAFERSTDAWGNPDYGFQMDPGFLLLSFAGALLLLGMAVFRMRGYGPGGVRSRRGARGKQVRSD